MTMPSTVLSAPADRSRSIVASPDAAADAPRRVLMAAAGFQFALLLPSLIAFRLDDRLVNDIDIWTKPIKFQLSLMMLMATIVLLLPLLPASIRGGRTIRWSTVALAFSSIAEIAYITLQAARGRPSHFNYSTPIEAFAYNLMGLGAVILVTAPTIIGWMIWRHGRSSDQPGLRAGAAWGLMLGGVLTLITASIMSSGAFVEPGHWVGGIRSDANGLFLMGWSTTGGDLRVPHFFATHIMQGLPILGLLADRFAPNQVRTIIAAGIVVSLLIVGLTFLQAMSGQPFIG